MTKIVFVWENFGPGHADRCEAVADALGNKGSVIGLELFGSSSTYQWESETRPNFQKITVFKNAVVEDKNAFVRFWGTLKQCLPHLGATFFLCHYEYTATLMLAVVLRCLGQKVMVMNDSKFDDYPRQLSRELLKSVFYLPYQGGLASGIRSIDYLRFLGLPEKKLTGNYNSLSLSRIRRLAGLENIDAITKSPFLERHFTIVARLVSKKNLFIALESYAEYCASTASPRKLHMAGSGPLESELKAHAHALGVDGLIVWHGFIQTDGVMQLLKSTLALLLLSTEEQFGNVIIEAHALGVPCIVSTNPGARDQLIRTGVNGFVVEPDNTAGTAFFMRLLSEDLDLWSKFSTQALATAHYGDTSNFAEAVLSLI
jgi:glycosyltransferase involved in cell wall biosynthesis